MIVIGQIVARGSHFEMNVIGSVRIDATQASRIKPPM